MYAYEDHNKPPLEVVVVTMILEGNEISLRGYSYIEETNSYQGKSYVVLVDKDGKQTCLQMTHYENNIREGNRNGRYSDFRLSCTINFDAQYQ